MVDFWSARHPTRSKPRTLTPMPLRRRTPGSRWELAWLFIKQVVQIRAGRPRAGTWRAVEVQRTRAKVPRDGPRPHGGRIWRRGSQLPSAAARRRPQGAHADRVAVSVAGGGGRIKARGQEAGRVAVRASHPGSATSSSGGEEQVRLTRSGRGRRAAMGSPSGRAA